jgi:hypothetical protein
LGFNVRKQPVPVGPLGAPQQFKAVPDANPGVVRLSCARLKGAKLYVYEMTQNIAGNVWEEVGQGTTKFRAEGLESGKQYWFRCYAVNTDSKSPVSDVAVTFVL